MTWQNFSTANICEFAILHRARLSTFTESRVEGDEAKMHASGWYLLSVARVWAVSAYLLYRHVSPEAVRYSRERTRHHQLSGVTILYWPQNIYPIFASKDPQKFVLWNANNPNFLIKTLFMRPFEMQRPQFPKKSPRISKFKWYIRYGIVTPALHWQMMTILHPERAHIYIIPPSSPNGRADSSWPRPAKPETFALT